MDTSAPSSIRPTIGVVGLGLMGAPIARVLAAKGWRVVAWNRHPEAVAALIPDGIEAADSPMAVAAEADIVLAVLSNGAAVREVALGPNGLTSGRPRGLLVDVSTTAPEDATGLAADLGARGWGFVDAPVSGGTEGAAAGRLSVMAGGDTKDVDRAREVLGTIASRIVHCGPVGAGQLTKACNQLCLMVTLAAVAEVMVLAKSCGLVPAAVREALLGGLSASPILELSGAKMLSRDFEPGGPVKYNLKDISTIRHLAASNALVLPMFTAAARQIEALVDGWGGDIDNSAVILLVEQEAAMAAAERRTGS